MTTASERSAKLDNVIDRVRENTDAISSLTVEFNTHQIDCAKNSGKLSVIIAILGVVGTGITGLVWLEVSKLLGL